MRVTARAFGIDESVDRALSLRKPKKKMEEEGLGGGGDNDDVEVRCHARVSAGKAPSERCLHTCTLMSVEGARVLYVFGGRGKGGALDDLHMLDLEGNLWSTPKQSGEKPAARFGHSAVCHNSRLYFFGGHSRGQSTFNFAEAGEKTSIVEKLKGKSKGQRESDTEAVDDVILLTTNQESGAEPSLAQSHEWSELDTGAEPGQRPSPRYKHAAALIPDKGGKARMLIFGGQDEEKTALNDVHLLDLQTKVWTKPEAAGQKPSPRYGHTATFIPAKRTVIVLGGTDGKHLESAAAAAAADPEFPSHKTRKSLCEMTTYSLDIDTMTWSTISCKNERTGAQPSPRVYHSSVLIGKNLFVTGGQTEYWLLANNNYIHGAYILEIVKKQWEHNTIKGDSFIPYPGCSLGGHTACGVDSSSLVILGGNLETTAGCEMTNTFWDVATDAKQKLNPSQLPTPTAGGNYSTTFKLLVVGDAGVGKTCLITRFVDDVFSSTSKSTIGVDFKATSVMMDGRQVALQVWDTAGQERFRALTTSYYRGAHGVIVVYDVTEQASFDHLEQWMKDVDLYSGEEVTKLLIGNKDDMPAKKVVDPEQAREFAKEHQMLFMEASAMKATNVSAAFRLLVAEVMHAADTVASQPPAFEHKLKVNMERSRRAQGGCGGCFAG